MRKTVWLCESRKSLDSPWITMPWTCERTRTLAIWEYCFNFKRARKAGFARCVKFLREVKPCKK
jgi:hypothetical protein